MGATMTTKSLFVVEVKLQGDDWRPIKIHPAVLETEEEAIKEMHEYTGKKDNPFFRVSEYVRKN